MNFNKSIEEENSSEPSARNANHSQSDSNDSYGDDGSEEQEYMSNSQYLLYSSEEQTPYDKIEDIQNNLKKTSSNVLKTTQKTTKNRDPKKKLFDEENETNEDESWAKSSKIIKSQSRKNMNPLQKTHKTIIERNSFSSNQMPTNGLKCEKKEQAVKAPKAQKHSDNQPSGASNMNIIKYIENQQNKIMHGSKKQAEQLAFNQNKRMKALDDRMNLFRLNSKKSKDQLASKWKKNGSTKQRNEANIQKKLNKTNWDENDFKVSSESKNVVKTAENNFSMLEPQSPQKRKYEKKTESLDFESVEKERTMSGSGHQKFSTREKTSFKKTSAITEKKQDKKNDKTNKVKKLNNNNAGGNNGVIGGTPKANGEKILLNNNNNVSSGGNGNGSKGNKVKKHYQLNDMYKIMNFLGEDKNLQVKKEELRDKMKKFREDTKRCDDEKDDYEEWIQHLDVKHTIGVGAHAVVKYGVDKRTGEEVAIKFYERMKMLDPIKLRNYELELENLRKLDHPNIIKLIDSFEGKRKYIMVMEYISSTTLLDIMEKNGEGKIWEHDCKQIFFQVFKAVEYTHEQNIIHRDIKIHNIIVGPKHSVKLVDYGFSIKIEKNKKLKVFWGTPSYMSPEIVKRIPYDGKASDVWALGICLYLCLVGNYPFKGVNVNDLYTKIKKGSPNYPKILSKEIKNLISCLLDVDMANRFTVSQALQHSWFHDLSLAEGSTLSNLQNY